MFEKYYLNREIKRLLKNNGRTREFRNMKKIKNVLIIFDLADYEVADESSTLLRQAGKTVCTIGFRKRLAPDDRQNIDFIVTEKDIRFNKSENMANIRNMLRNARFDLLIDLSVEENPLLQYIVLLTNALMKIGFRKCSIKIHDMLILSPSGDHSNPASIKDLEQQMIYYLSTIETY